MVLIAPMTIEELRVMDGKPVYVRYPDGKGEYGLVETMMGLEHIKICFKYGMRDIKKLIENGAQFFCFKPRGGIQ